MDISNLEENGFMALDECGEDGEDSSSKVGEGGEGCGWEGEGGFMALDECGEDDEDSSSKVVVVRGVWGGGVRVWGRE